MFVAAKANDKFWKGVFNGKAGLIPMHMVRSAVAPPRILRHGLSCPPSSGPFNGHHECSPTSVVSGVMRCDLYTMRPTLTRSRTRTHNGAVQVIDASAAAEVDPAKAGCKCIAVKTLVNENPGALSFKIGQSIFVQVGDYSHICERLLGVAVSKGVACPPWCADHDRCPVSSLGAHLLPGQNANPAVAEWKGVCNSTVGTFPKDYVLDSSKVCVSCYPPPHVSTVSSIWDQSLGVRHGC